MKAEKRALEVEGRGSAGSNKGGEGAGSLSRRSSVCRTGARRSEQLDLRREKLS